jgi:hypothetical protein
LRNRLRTSLFLFLLERQLNVPEEAEAEKSSSQEEAFAHEAQGCSEKASHIDANWGKQAWVRRL